MLEHYHCYFGIFYSSIGRRVGIMRRRYAGAMLAFVRASYAFVRASYAFDTHTPALILT